MSSRKSGAGHSRFGSDRRRAAGDVHDVPRAGWMSSLGCLGLSVVIHSLNVLAFYLVGWMLFPAMKTTYWPSTS